MDDNPVKHVAITVDSDAIDTIIAALTRLKAQNVQGIEVDTTSREQVGKLWISENDRAIMQARGSSFEEALNLRKTTEHQFTHVRNTLSLLVYTATAQADHLREDLLPFIFHHKIATLPNEVLACVFELVHAKGERDYLALLRVSRRFYHLALSLPGLWTYISNSMRKGVLRRHIERSKDTGLDIHIRSTKSPREISRFMDEILSHTHRWRSFSIHAERLQISHYRFIKHFQHRYPSLHLPRLQRLNFRIWSWEGGCKATTNSDISTMWDIPNLRSLGVCNVLPTASFNAKLESFSIDIFYGRDATNFAKLARFLASVPTLERLKLCFRATHSEDDIPKFELPNLRSLSILIEDICKPQRIYAFMSALHTPRLTFLHYHIGIDDESRYIFVNEYLDCLFPRAHRYDGVREFSLHVLFAYVDYRKPNVPLNLPLERLANIHTLSIRAPAFKPPHIPTLAHFKSLKKITLTNCTRFTIDFVENLLRGGLSDVPSNNIEMIEVVDCLRLDHASLFGLLPANKIRVVKTTRAYRYSFSSLADTFEDDWDESVFDDYMAHSDDDMDVESSDGSDGTPALDTEWGWSDGDNDNYNDDDDDDDDDYFNGDGTHIIPGIDRIQI